MDKLTGKVAVVTGASRGIGAGIAKRLAARGAKVVVNYARNAGAAEDVVHRIREDGGEAVAVQADMTDPAQIKRLIETALKAYGRLDILVNNAGLFEMRALEEIDQGHYERVFNLNVRAPLLATVEAAKHFGPDGGRVINISSGAARGILAASSVYSATKAALEALTRGHALDLGPKGVTVNAVAPGLTDTEMLREGLTEQARRQMVQNTALGRLGTPEDIADVVVFLASDQARWITGQSIDVNGGLRY
jgi:3-oxoacyl-[acyl-carrier protein] reductase